MSRAKLRTPEQEAAAFAYLSTARVAERLTCARQHVVRLIQSGALKAINIGSRSRPEYRVRPEWLEAFEAARQVNDAA